MKQHYRGEPRRKESDGFWNLLSFIWPKRWERERLGQWPQLGDEGFICSAIQISFGWLCATLSIRGKVIRFVFLKDDSDCIMMALSPWF